MAFEVVVETMIEMTVFQLLFPWLLVLAVTYGVLNQYKTISEEESVNAAIAIAIAFMAVGGSYLFIPEGMLTHLVAGLTFGLFAVIGLLIVMGAAGFDLKKLTEEERSLPVLIGVSIFMLVLVGVSLTYTSITDALLEATSALLDEEDPDDLFNDYIMPVLILVFILGIVVLTARSSSGEEE